MSPVPVVFREQVVGRTEPVPPRPPLELLLGPPKEIVVDWQLPTDFDRR